MTDPTASPAGVDRPFLDPVPTGGWPVGREDSEPLDTTPAIPWPRGYVVTPAGNRMYREDAAPLDPHDGEGDGIPNVGPLLTHAVVGIVCFIAGIVVTIAADLLT